MKEKSIITKFFMTQFLIWGVFSLFLSSTPISILNDTKTNEFFNPKFNAVDFSNSTVISDGFGGAYWNDGASYSPAIAVDKSDAMHVVWHDHTDGVWGTDIEIMYASYTNATGWSNVTVISDGQNYIYWNDGNSNNPKIVVDGNDAIHVVWEDFTDSGWGIDYEIMHTQYTSIMGWSLPLVISDGYGGDHWNNGVSAGSSIATGTTAAHVVWYDGTHGVWGMDYEIMYTSISIPEPPCTLTPSGGIPGYDIFILVFGVFGVTYLFIRRKLKKFK